MVGRGYFGRLTKRWQTQHLESDDKYTNIW